MWIPELFEPHRKINDPRIARRLTAEISIEHARLTGWQYALAVQMTDVTSAKLTILTLWCSSNYPKTIAPVLRGTWQLTVHYVQHFRVLITWSSTLKKLAWKWFAQCYLLADRSCFDLMPSNGIKIARLLTVVLLSNDSKEYQWMKINNYLNKCHRKIWKNKFWLNITE